MSYVLLRKTMVLYAAADVISLRNHAHFLLRKVHPKCVVNWSATEVSLHWPI